MSAATTPSKVPVEETIDMESFKMKRTQTTLHQTAKKRNIGDYFTGPRDMNHFSKWPFFFQMHGSITPKMVLPMLIVTAWASVVVCACKFKFKTHSLDPILLTVLGFVVALSLSFRSTTAYERYMEGRRFWGSFTVVSHNLARIVWVHAKERPGSEKEDLLGKVTFLNLIVALAHAFKHKLRHEPYLYDDLRNVRFLDTYAGQVKPGIENMEDKDAAWQRVGQFLGVSFAETNPRAAIKKATQPLGNLPLEIMVHLQSYVDKIIDDGALKAPAYQMNTVNALNSLNEIMIGCERILNCPLPIAYSICITQITWVYIVLLPLQLYAKLGWYTIPATALAAYIILGIALIGSEVENPFGRDVNDLPLDSLCDQIASDIAIVTSTTSPKAADFLTRQKNLPLYPLSQGSYSQWAERSEDDIREALRSRVLVGWRAGGHAATSEAPSTPTEWS